MIGASTSFLQHGSEGRTRTHGGNFWRKKCCCFFLGGMGLGRFFVIPFSGEEYVYLYIYIYYMFVFIFRFAAYFSFCFY